MVEQKTVGSRAQVMHGTAKKTSGGLTKKQLKYNTSGKIVSKKASALAKKNNRLVKAGFVTKKGVFGNNNMSGGSNPYTIESLIDFIYEQNTNNEIQIDVIIVCSKSDIHMSFKNDLKVILGYTQNTETLYETRLLYEGQTIDAIVKALTYTFNFNMSIHTIPCNRLGRTDTKKIKELIQQTNIRSANFSNIKLTDFTMGRMIEKGGFGAVHECEVKKDDTRTDNVKFNGEIIPNGRYAIKIIDLKIIDPTTELMTDRPSVSFIKEARNQMLLNKKEAESNSSHIMKCYGYFEENFKFYIIMELCDGVDMIKYADDFRMLPVIDRCKIVYDILKGLTIMHQHNIAWRDIKPDNIMVCKDATPGGKLHVKLIDFGLIDTSYGYKTMLKGTPAYIAPEQGNPGSKIQNINESFKIDIFAIGVLIFELFQRNNHPLYIRNGLYYYKVPNPSSRYPSLLDHESFFRLHSCDINTGDSIARTVLKDIIQNCIKQDPSSRPPLYNKKNQPSDGIDDIVGIVEQTSLMTRMEYLIGVLSLHPPQ